MSARLGATTGYTVVPALSSRLQVTTSGHLASIGQLQASDAGTYMISSSEFNGVLNFTLKLFGMYIFILVSNNEIFCLVGEVHTVTLDWMAATSVPLLPSAPSGYTVVPALSSRLSITNSGELVSTGQLQASDAGTYMITSSDFTGEFLVMIQVSG